MSKQRSYEQSDVPMPPIRERSLSEKIDVIITRLSLVDARLTNLERVPDPLASWPAQPLRGGVILNHHQTTPGRVSWTIRGAT